MDFSAPFPFLSLTHGTHLFLAKLSASVKYRVLQSRPCHGIMWKREITGWLNEASAKMASLCFCKQGGPCL